MICEMVALILYVPPVFCVLTSGQCEDRMLGAQDALWAVTSPDAAKAALGRFTLGLTFLRTFGLVRHWKQMWINHTFEGRKPESSKSNQSFSEHSLSQRNATQPDSNIFPFCSLGSQTIARGRKEEKADKTIFP